METVSENRDHALRLIIQLKCPVSRDFAKFTVFDHRTAANRPHKARSTSKVTIGQLKCSSFNCQSQTVTATKPYVVERQRRLLGFDNPFHVVRSIDLCIHYPVSF